MPDSLVVAAWPRALREREAAAYVGLSASTFRAKVARQVRAIRLTPGCVAWLREDLDRWLDERKAEAVDAPPVAAEAPARESHHHDSRPYRDELRARLAAARRARGPIATS